MPYFISYGETAKSSIESDFHPILEHDLLVLLVSDKKLSLTKKKQIPRILRVGVTSRVKRIPDIIGKSMGNWCVSKSIKEKLEELEPGIHEYFPIKVQFKDNKFWPENYYLVRILQTLEAVNYEETAFRGKKYGYEAARETKYSLDIRWGGPCVLQKEKLHNVHLWRWGGESALRYFCSDDLRDFIVNNRMTGWSFYKCESR